MKLLRLVERWKTVKRKEGGLDKMVELQRERSFFFPDIKGQRFKRCYRLDRAW